MNAPAEYFQRAQQYIRQRKTAYQLAFNIRLKAWTRKRAFRIVFGGPAGQMVMQDLLMFCRATETCFDADPRKHAVLEGRREVWLRIQQHLQLTPDQLYALYGGKTLQLNQPQEADDE
jgi:hypothetical protein